MIPMAPPAGVAIAHIVFFRFVIGWCCLVNDEAVGFHTFLQPLSEFCFLLLCERFSVVSRDYGGDEMFSLVVSCVCLCCFRYGDGADLREQDVEFFSYVRCYVFVLFVFVELVCEV